MKYCFIFSDIWTYKTIYCNNIFKTINFFFFNIWKKTNISN